MTFIVGLTGGIGCGKSSVSKLFSDLGIDVIDTDIMARKLTEPYSLAIRMIQNAFGDTFIAADGSLDRNKMRSLIFSDNDSRLKLEKILHPLILKETVRQAAQTESSYTIIVVPLLFESNDYDNIIQRILVVDCEEQQQILRTMARSKLSEQEVKAIMSTQVSREYRLQKADDIIINNHDINYLKTQVVQLHQKYLTLSKSNSAT
jgi:dephospho-CoA kinase